MNLIGRENEIKELQDRYASPKAEFVAIYGRRRVGKTFLVNECFKDVMTFSHTGLPPFREDEDVPLDQQSEKREKALLKDQLLHFQQSLEDYGYVVDGEIVSWLSAFSHLKKFLLQKKAHGTKQVVFIDELPWLDTPKSGFLRELAYFWNNWGNKQDQLLFIVCGSAASWMSDKLINGIGGLYDRIDLEIKLLPLSLHQMGELLQSRHFHWTEYDIAQLYMIIGGVPFYVSHMNKDLSLAQNVDKMFFKRNAPLAKEYRKLFRSCFKKPDLMQEIVRFLSGRSIGYTREEICEAIKLSSGGNISEMLDALLSSDFVISYVPYGEAKNNRYYKLVDPFCLFYLRFVENATSLDTSFWAQNATSSRIIAWRGLAYENVVFNHIDQIKFALGISGVATNEFPYFKKGDEEGKGTQIDLIIDRADNLVDICEVKFYKGPYVVDKTAYEQMLERENAIFLLTKKKKTIHHVLIASHGAETNEYSREYNIIITLEDLFRF